MNSLYIKGISVILIQFIFIFSAHAQHCKGPHKNDPGCGTTTSGPAATTGVKITSVQIDWLNETITVGGENFSASTTVTIAGTPATVSSQTATQLSVSTIGLPKGNHNLVVDDATSTSSDSMSIYVKSEMVDPTLTGCPCATEWASALGSLWNPTPHVTDCYELSPGGAGNPEDISGTVLTDASDSSVYPQYPIGAAFTEEPNESVCQLTEVNQSSGLPVTTDLVKKRINRLQQGDCHAVLVNNICGNIITIP
ncbi:MAG: IPT/TIG domain-containing protein [Gammaproteobacteria bacterium]